MIPQNTAGTACKKIVKNVIAAGQPGAPGRLYWMELRCYPWIFIHLPRSVQRPMKKLKSSSKVASRLNRTNGVGNPTFSIGAILAICGGTAQ